MKPLLIIYLFSFFITSCASAQPEKVGLKIENGKERLHPCPKSPNCISSYNDHEEKEKHHPAVTYQDKIKKFNKIKECIKKRKGTKIIKETSHYIHFTSTSSFMGFIDDTEFYFDESDKKMHFRSASRTGYSDFGVNRKRVLAILDNCRKD